MRKLKDLIQELCPDGVDYKKLGEITVWNKKFKGVDQSLQPKILPIHSVQSCDLDKMKSSGDIFLLYSGTNSGYTSVDKAKGKINEREVISIPEGKSSPLINVIKYYNGKFVSSNNLVCSALNADELILKYLYYCLCNISEIIDDCYNGNSLKHPVMSKILELEIPIPPLPVQEEIVRILDTFTELEKELEKRILQFSHYRSKMLSFENVYGSPNYQIRYLPIKDVYQRLKGTPITAQNMKEIENIDGNIKIFAGGKTAVMANENDIPNANITRVPSVLVQSRGIIDFVYYDKPFTFKNEMWAYTADDPIKVKYLYHWLKTQTGMLKNIAEQRGSMPQISLADTEDMMIPIPSIEVQRRIVNTLDNFEAICSDLNIGLPAELNARREQYSYFQTVLLTFASTGEIVRDAKTNTPPLVRD